MTRSSSEVSISTSVLAGVVWVSMSGAPSGDCAMSESDDVPGLSLAFFEGDGLSTGPGVLVALTTLGFSGSSAIVSSQRMPRC
jgi:hypothetical protein